MRKFDTNGRRLVEYQAKLFERSIERYACSSSIFLSRFVRSEVVKMLDKNEIGLVYMDIQEALDAIEEEFGISNYGKVKYSKDEMFWLGYFLRYISYTREIDTRLIFKFFDIGRIIDSYYVFHTQDMEWCITNILEMNNYTEDIFDPNWRLRQAMLKDLNAQQ